MAETCGLDPELLLHGYAAGVFPMAERRDSAEVFWVDPERRGVLPLDGFHLSRSLKRTISRGVFRPTLDADFAGVVEGCAERSETWINAEIADAYQKLHEMGRAHSLEVWRDGVLVGGVYGVVLGRAFFGESMFSRARDASKVALATLVAHLGRTGFTLFDTQFLTDHLASLGAREISRATYHDYLEEALRSGAADITARPLPEPHSVIHWVTQMSNRA
ncbi:MAG: leucyl/phenylalanyl-tRNA--protein transferase [Rhodobacterales bacterium]|nr:MAG: leucyl/phenylalanyl-tRNA--protein transferase [Rhodobacterales bacterium]